MGCPGECFSSTGRVVCVARPIGRLLEHRVVPGNGLDAQGSTNPPKKAPQLVTISPTTRLEVRAQGILPLSQSRSQLVSRSVGRSAHPHKATRVGASSGNAARSGPGRRPRRPPPIGGVHATPPCRPVGGTKLRSAQNVKCEFQCEILM